MEIAQGLMCTKCGQYHVNIVVNTYEVAGFHRNQNMSKVQWGPIAAIEMSERSFKDIQRYSKYLYISLYFRNGGFLN